MKIKDRVLRLHTTGFAYVTFQVCDFQVSFVYYLGFLSRTFTILGTAGERGTISLIPLYYFYPLQRKLDVSQAITKEGSFLDLAKIWTPIVNLSILSPSR